MKEIVLLRRSVYKDGGSTTYSGNDGNDYWLDNRCNKFNLTKGLLFKGKYPDTSTVARGRFVVGPDIRKRFNQ